MSKAYSLPPLALPISATASGWLPTPTGSNGGANHTSPAVRERGHGLNLAGAARLWPTPSASDNRDRGNLSNACVQRRMRIGKQLMLSQVVSDQSGQLNPRWVEWLMGFPDGWTDLSNSETP